MSPEDLENRFAFHPADTSQKAKSHSEVRDQCLQLAHFLNVRIPEGREKALVMTKLEEAMFWSNAAIARNYRSAPAPL